MADKQPAAATTHPNPRIERDRRMIAEARAQGRGAMLRTFVRLSGPGWLQSGITVGGVSFASSLYLGVLSGFTFLWLQPVAMMWGIAMLAAIAYVTLSTGERPLRAINKHVSPVLGWSWLLASMAANLVWSMPQFSLGTAAIQQNLLPGVFGGGEGSLIQGDTARVVAVLLFLTACIAVSMFYSLGGRGVRIFENIIRAIVSMIVLCFLFVVLKLTFRGQMDWAEAAKGLVPHLKMLFQPVERLAPYLQAVAESGRAYWVDMITDQQRGVIISAIAATVGINMTFMFPYSMMRRGWDKDFRGLAIFDLSTGLFIPFVLATGFVVMAASSQFHTKPAPGFVPAVEGGVVTETPAPNLVGQYNTLLKNRVAFEVGKDAFASLSADEQQKRVDALPHADKLMAAMLVKRDNFNLANTLTPLTGKTVAQYLFGLGVMGLGLSAATILMSINGLCFCEMLGKAPGGWTQRIGSLMVSVGAIGAIFWKQPAPWLAIATSAFCSVLLPIAYFTFLLMMNSKGTLGDSLPTGGRRILWNVLMVFATAAATFVSIWSLWPKIGWWTLVLIGAFVGLSLIVHFLRRNGAKGIAT
ncbi:MAG TPA: divalent metal cation transporter [Sedimentisphaerales bacterium]|jgi:Mn2+/Fe2+ NRAMP family transporter|nr:divalent metal cation transporter [Sedimentisphaerales bacterium]HNU28714.1 divalent metal cation transporter [Sedimentisphaerales bacterium]